MILIDYKDSRPIYEQIIEKLQELMVLGVLEEDSQLPSVRTLALELSINPNTIQRAYGELERQGFIYGIKGKGCFVGSINKIRSAKRLELIKRINKVAAEAKSVAITKEEFLDYAAKGYEKGGTEYDTGSKPDETL